MALRLRADIHLATGETGKAVKSLEEAREVNDHDESTLGRLAACCYLLKQTGTVRQNRRRRQGVQPETRAVL